MTDREKRLRAAIAAARAAAAPENRPTEKGKGRRAESAATQKRFSRGFASVGDSAFGALRDAAGGRGIADPRLLTRWSEIVGDRLAEACRPLRIKHRGGAALGGVLVVAARRGAATEIEHQSATILERVNRFFGYAAAAELRIDQASQFAAAEAAEAARAEADRADREARRRPPRLSPEAQERLDASTAAVSDDRLREALRRLGARVIDREEKERRRAARGA